MTSKIFGSFAEGFGEIIPASSDARTLKVQFKSNKRKNGGGFRCQVCLQCGSWFSFFNDFPRLPLLLDLLDLGLGLRLALVPGNTSQEIEILVNTNNS